MLSELNKVTTKCSFQKQNNIETRFFFHIHTVQQHLDIIKVFFIHQLMHKLIVFKKFQNLH